MSETGGRAAQPGDSGQDARRGREAVLARVFVRLADTLASDFDIVDFLHGLSHDSVQILAAEAAGVMIADARGGLRLVASSDERMRVLELFELQDAQGPCMDAFSTGRAVQADAADSRTRWPDFAPHAFDAGFQTMCAVPLRLRTDVIGALNVFRRTDEPFTDDEMNIAKAMGEIAAIGLIQERALRERTLLTEQLQGALNSRIAIEQAKGMLAEHLGVTMDDAFQLLRSYSRDHNRKLSVAARDVVNRNIPSSALNGPRVIGHGPDDASGTESGETGLSSSGSKRTGAAPYVSWLT